jgi:hypothetical protein
MTSIAYGWVEFVDFESPSSLKEIFKKGIIWLSLWLKVCNVIKSFLELSRKILEESFSMGQFRMLYPL